jgi:hypothetical protein
VRNRRLNHQGCLAGQEGLTYNQGSQCFRVYHDDDRRRQNHPLFLCLPRCESEQIVQESLYQGQWRDESRLPILAEVQSITAQDLDRRQNLPLRFRSETLRLCCSVISNFFLSVLHASSFLPAVVGFVQKRHMM